LPEPGTASGVHAGIAAHHRGGTTMDGHRFDRISKWLVTRNTRRSTVRALAAGAVAIGLGRLGLNEAAAKKKRKRKKTLRKNEFGCVNVGKACRGKDANCCSGICQGKKPKKGKKDKSKCAAHNVLDCAVGANSCLGNVIACGTNGHCNQTTGQASFCGGASACFACTKDVDCEPDFGPGAACIVCDGCPSTSDNICASAAA